MKIFLGCVLRYEYSRFSGSCWRSFEVGLINYSIQTTQLHDCGLRVSFLGFVQSLTREYYFVKL